MKTVAQVVADANELARRFYSLQGYQAPKGYRFDEARHPQERLMWDLAVTAYEHIEGTDVEDCVVQMEDEPTHPERPER